MASWREDSRMIPLQPGLFLIFAWISDYHVETEVRIEICTILYLDSLCNRFSVVNRETT